MVDKLTSASWPPQTKEFDAVILEPLLKRYFKWHPATSEANAESGNQVASSNVTKEVHHYHESHPRKRKVYSSDETPASSPAKRHRKSAHNGRINILSSPSSDIPVGTLSPLMNYCKTTYTTYAKWDDVFTVLRQEDVDMESLGDRTTGERIKQLCPEMKLATAKRLAKAHYGFVKTQLFNKS
jgi:hypothetical protein